MATNAFPLPPGAKLVDDPQALKLPPGAALVSGGAPEGKTIGSASSRFFGNLWDKTAGGAVGTAKVLFDLASHGANPTTPLDPTGPAAQFLQNTIQAHIDQGSKAKDAFSQGRYSESAGHMLAAALPFIGPAAASAGEQIGGADAKYDKYGKVIEAEKAPDIAGGLGSATALLAPMAVGPAVGKIAGKLDVAADSAAQGLTKSALKGGYNVTAPAADVTEAVSTMRANKIPLSTVGQEKISAALADLRQRIADKTHAATQDGATIDPRAVEMRLDDARSRYVQQVNPTQDLKEINRVGENFLSEHTTTTPAQPASTVLGANGQPLRAATPATSKSVPIPADQAQAIKVGSNSLNADKYGKVSTAQVEAEKALTRGIKEELETQIPELKGLNAAQAKLMNLDSILGKAVNKYTNSEGFAGDLGHTGIAASALRSVIANPILKARLATMIDSARRANPGTFARVGADGAARVNSFIAALTPTDKP